MTTEAVAFSDLINKPVATVRRLLHARRLRLVRRDDEDLVLMSARSYEEQRMVIDAATLTLVSLARHRRDIGPTLDRIIVEVFPWVRFLSPNEVREFTKELTETLIAADSIENMTPVAHLITQWKHTAEVYADPEIYAVLSSDSGADFGPVPAPSAVSR
jgi:hypothetical protein